MTLNRAILSIGLPVLLAAAAPALAQNAAITVGGTASASNGGRATGEMQTNQSRNQAAPVGTVLGVPVVISAPVDAPYNSAAAYSTYEGQPGYGPNAVLAASDAGAP